MRAAETFIPLLPVTGLCFVCLLLLLIMMAADMFCMEGLKGELSMTGFSAAAPLRYMRIVSAHRFRLEHLELGINPFQFSL